MELDIFISVKTCEKTHLICLKPIPFWGLLMLTHKAFTTLVHSSTLVGPDPLNHSYPGSFASLSLIFIGNAKLQIKIICNRYQSIYIYENITLKVYFILKTFFATYHQISDFACRSTCKYPFFQFFAWVTDVLKNWIPYISYHTLCSPVNVKLRIYRISTLYF